MKNDFLKGVQEIKNIKLSPEEKGVVLSRLMEHMNQYSAQPVISPYQYFFHSRLAYAIAGALIMLSVTSSGVALAAEGSLPGDILYPVKIYVNEPVRGALIVGNVQKAQWVAKKTVRRLDEAESLSAQGRLSTTTAQIVREKVTENTDEFNAIIRDSGAQASSTEMEKVHADFEAELETHAQVLRISTSTPDVQKHDQEQRQRQKREDVQSSQIQTQETSTERVRESDSSSRREEEKEGD